MIEAASWRLTADLVRRYPLSFRVTETHPGAGQYDCLTLRNIDWSVQLDRIDLNRAGSVHACTRAGEAISWRGAWAEMVATHDLRALVDRLCRTAGLEPIDRLPASTHASITYRVVAAFLSHATFGRRTWECRNGMLDTSGEFGGSRDQYFDFFPAVRARFSRPAPEGLPEDPSYRFWFLVEDGEPRLALEPLSGLAWGTGGGEHHLRHLYRSAGRRIWPALWQVAGDLLP